MQKHKNSIEKYVLAFRTPPLESHKGSKEKLYEQSILTLCNCRGNWVIKETNRPLGSRLV